VVNIRGNSYRMREHLDRYRALHRPPPRKQSEKATMFSGGVQGSELLGNAPANNPGTGIRHGRTQLALTLGTSRSRIAFSLSADCAIRLIRLTGYTVTHYAPQAQEYGLVQA